MVTMTYLDENKCELSSEISTNVTQWCLWIDDKTVDVSLVAEKNNWKNNKVSLKKATNGYF